ncbi:hypothetical protein VPH35_007797 [Triticum aestivum]|uniref:uncharacterized protein n=1 Tax=Triticum aestivum TaxID=4565 RepID=UPI001D00818F|nr:uncharacterized protein LOC123117381 [Triticum aestivum]
MPRPHPTPLSATTPATRAFLLLCPSHEHQVRPSLLSRSIVDPAIFPRAPLPTALAPRVKWPCRRSPPATQPVATSWDQADGLLLLTQRRPPEAALQPGFSRGHASCESRRPAGGLLPRLHTVVLPLPLIHRRPSPTASPVPSSPLLVLASHCTAGQLEYVASDSKSPASPPDEVQLSLKLMLFTIAWL